MKKIIRNRIKCNTCGDIIESTYTHELVTCGCKRVSADGGKEYLRRCFTNSTEDFTELSEVEEI